MLPVYTTAPTTTPMLSLRMKASGFCRKTGPSAIWPVDQQFNFPAAPSPQTIASPSARRRRARYVDELPKARAFGSREKCDDRCKLASRTGEAAIPRIVRQMRSGPFRLRVRRRRRGLPQSARLALPSPGFVIGGRRVRRGGRLHPRGRQLESERGVGLCIVDGTDRPQSKIQLTEL